MSKQNSRLILIIVVAVAAFAVFRNVLSRPDAQVKQAVHEGAFLVDVRTPAEFADGSANGAVNIPLDEVEGRLPEFSGKKQIVVFCRSGNRAGKAKEILEANGLQHVVNGGSWQAVKDAQQ